MNQIHISEKLYGRKNEKSYLLNAFENISSGYGKILLIPGPSGVGKTALVEELESPVNRRNGFFIKGKFDQYHNNIPYFAFKQAFSELYLKLSSWGESEKQRLKNEINRTIGDQGQVLLDLIPEFQALLGPQKELQIISPQEARHRLDKVFRSFLEVICGPEHPLVLFIDDWQWADSASFELLKQIQIGLSVKYILVIASYRSNEVDSNHPLTTTINDMRRQSIVIESLEVNNLSNKDVESIIKDALRQDISQPDTLVELVYKYTLGNPFYVWSFIKYLFEFEFIYFDKNANCWQLSLQNGKVKLPDSITELFKIKLNNTKPEIQNLVSLAACIGNRFNVKDLSIISELNPEECINILSSNEANEIVKPLNKQDENIENISYFFLHDRLQQAAYSLIKPKDLSSIHLSIGRLFLGQLDSKGLSERIFAVINSLNQGLKLIKEESEKLRVFELNIRAAREAYSTTAYASALKFYRTAASILNDQEFSNYIWQKDHGLAISLLKEQAECEFLEGNIEKSASCLNYAISCSNNSIEKAGAINIFIVHYTLLAMYPKAIQSARDALQVLGIDLPENEYEKASLNEIKSVKEKLKGLRISSLYDLPEMSDPKMLMATKILITMGPPCYRADQKLWSVMVPKVINLILQYGNIPQLGYSHPAFGGLLGWVMNDYSTAKEFSKLATSLMDEKFDSPSDKCVFYLMNGSSIRHWFKHLKYGSLDYQAAYDIGVKSGNLQYAAYAFGHNMYCQFYQAVPLNKLINDTEFSKEFSHSRQNIWATDLMEGGLAIFSSIVGQKYFDSKNAIWLEEKYIQKIDQHYNIQVKCIFFVLKAFSLLLLGKYKEALVYSDQATPIIYTVGTQGLLPWAEHVFARFMILTALYHSASNEQQKLWDKELNNTVRQLSIWAKNGKDNFKHKYLLAKAELSKISGGYSEAIQLYDKAILEAKNSNFLQWEGIANERANNFWKENGGELIARDYWQKAYTCFYQWGAKAKLRSMEKEYKKYISKALSPLASFNKTKERNDRTIIDSFFQNQLVDIQKDAVNIQQLKSKDKSQDHSRKLEIATKRLRVEIAERKLAEKTSQRYSKIFEDSLNEIFLFRSDNLKFIQANDAALKNIGFTIDELINMTPVSIKPEFTDDHFNETLKSLRNKKDKKIVLETIHQRKDKTQYQAEVHLQLMEFDNEEVFVAIVLDITKRKRLEAELLSNKELLNETGKSAKVGGWEIDLTGNTLAWTEETFRIHEVSGEKQPDVADAIKFYHPDDQDMVAYALDKAISSLQPFDFEARLITNNNNQIWVQSNGNIVEENGKAVRILGSIQDITQRKKIDSELVKAKEKAEESDRLKSAFLANMSHEIRTPMNGILGFTNLLKERKLTGEKQDKYIDVIESSGQRLLSTVNDLIDISKIESGQMNTFISEFDVNKLIKDAFVFFNVEAKKKDLKLVLSSSSQITDLFLSDKEKLYSILSNLIKNAIKYTQSGSVEFGYKKDEKQLEFFVKDSGDGIPKDRLESIFDRFIRAESHENTVIEGSGLGLSISKAYVEMLGGKIWVESEVAVGSQFYFTIPFNTGKSKTTKSKELTPEPKSHIKKLKVLIAEDEQIGFELLSEMLADFNKELLHATTGIEAVELCRNNSDIDLVLMDVRMPNMNGHEAVKQIRKFNKDVIIIAQTAYALAGDHEKSIEAGCNDYISKPIKQEELFEKIEKCFSRN